MENKKEIMDMEKNENKSLKKDSFIFNLFFINICLFAIEIIFRFLNDFEIFSYATLRIFLSTFIISLLFTLISFLTKKKWLKNTILLILVFFYSIYTWLQIGFINYLGVYISFHTSSQFGAVKDYIGDFLLSFKWTYYLVFIPFIFALSFYILGLRKREYIKPNIGLNTIKALIVIFISMLIYYSTLIIPFMQNDLQIKSNKKLFINPDVPTVAVNQFGVMVFGALDLKSFIFPVQEEEEAFKFEESQQPVNREVSPALMDIAKDETNKKYTNLNNFFASQEVTDYNEYTGMFEGKNVIIILMESVNEAFINEEFFPNFYKLYSEGWHWENNYSPRNSCATGNNEFSAMTGLYSIYNTCTSNVYKDNSYFEAIFNLFNNKGYTTTSMHDFVEWFYKRKTIHPNMGSMKYYNANNLDIETASYYGEWPSDEEFFEKAMDIVLNDNSGKPFMTWLTTVTTHQPYTNNSTYGELYKADFKAKGYSNAVSRYFSKLKVLDNAIGIMLDKLKAAGKLDDTVILLTADHYPYGLNRNYISEMIKHDLNDYEIERTPFVIYNSTMSPKTFSEYSSYLNLTPTIANLMNLDFDPRLYMGKDLLSKEYTSRVVFADGSWKNELAYYNASNSKITYYKEDAYTPEEIQQINNEVALQIQMSTNAIKNNYFKYLEEKITEYNSKLQQDVEEDVTDNSVDASSNPEEKTEN